MYFGVILTVSDVCAPTIALPEFNKTVTVVGIKFERDPVKNTALAVIELDALNRLYCIFVTVRVL